MNTTQLDTQMKTLWISFCNQIGAANQSLSVVNLDDTVAAWIDLTTIIETQQQNFTGICGLASYLDRYLIVVFLGPKQVAINSPSSMVSPLR